eukprot:190321_1
MENVTATTATIYPLPNEICQPNIVINDQNELLILGGSAGNNAVYKLSTNDQKWIKTNQILTEQWKSLNVKMFHKNKILCADNNVIYQASINNLEQLCTIDIKERILSHMCQYSEIPGTNLVVLSG